MRKFVLALLWNTRHYTPDTILTYIVTIPNAASCNKKIIVEATDNKDKVYLFNSIGVLISIVRTPQGRTELPVLAGNYVAWCGKKVFKLIVE